jgi:hypothetical protein
MSRAFAENVYPAHAFPFGSLQNVAGTTAKNSD